MRSVVTGWCSSKQATCNVIEVSGPVLQVLREVYMNADKKNDNDEVEVDVDETPEYPLPSPTDSLSRDQRPPDDEDEVPSDE